MGTWARSNGASTLWLALVIVAALLGQIMLLGAQPARAAGLVPREIAITDDEAGRQAARAIDKDGEDNRSVWVQPVSYTHLTLPTILRV